MNNAPVAADYAHAAAGFSATLAPMLTAIMPVLVIILAIWLAPHLLKKYVKGFADFSARQERARVMEKQKIRGERRAARIKEANAHNEVMRRIEEKGGKASAAEKYYHRLHKDDWERTKSRLETGRAPRRAVA